MMLAESIEEEKEGHVLWTGRQPLAVGKSLITGCSGAVSIGGGDFVAGTEEVSCGVVEATDTDCGKLMGVSARGWRVRVYWHLLT